jgi:hypothetical protein
MSKDLFFADPWQSFLRGAEVPNVWWIHAIQFDHSFRQKLFDTLAHDFSKEGTLGSLSPEWLTRIRQAPAFLSEFFNSLAASRHVLEWVLEFFDVFGVHFLESVISERPDIIYDDECERCLQVVRAALREKASSHIDAEQPSLEELDALLQEISTARRFGARPAPMTLRAATSLNCQMRKALSSSPLIPREPFRIYVDFLATNIPVDLGGDDDDRSAWADFWESLWVVS